MTVSALNEVRGFEREIEHLEDTHRHDLAIHLYLSFLLHQVNPLFPSEKWASWPQRNVTDPTVYEDYEDGLLDQNNDFVQLANNEDFRHEDKDKEDKDYEPNDGIDDMKDVDDDVDSDESDQKTEFLRPGPGIIRLHKLRRQKTHAKALLVNEMHALLQKRITRKLALLGCLDASQLVDVDSPVLRHMALQMANRMGKVLYRLRQQRHLTRISSENGLFLDSRTYRKFYKQNWQDVVTADLKGTDRGSRVDLHRLRDLYARCRKLFKDVKYDYEYDPEEFGPGRSKDETPIFDVETHLEEIELDPAYSIAPIDPMRLIEEGKKISAFKEHVFIKLWDLAGNGQQLSYRSDDNPGHLEEAKDEKEKVMRDNGLNSKDFLQH